MILCPGHCPLCPEVLMPWLLIALLLKAPLGPYLCKQTLLKVAHSGCPLCFLLGPWLVITPSSPTSASVPLHLLPDSLPSLSHPQVTHSLGLGFTWSPLSLNVLSKSYPFSQAQLHPGLLPQAEWCLRSLLGEWLLEYCLSRVCPAGSQGKGEGLQEISIS